MHALDLSPHCMWEVLGDTRRVDLLSLPTPLGAQADEVLAGALAILHSHGITATTEVRTGQAAVEILVAAQEHRAHLVVMDSRGLSGIRGLRLGSVTQRVVRHGASSVLIARESGSTNLDDSPTAP